MTNTSKDTPTHYFLSLSRRPVPLFGSYHMLISGATIFIAYMCP